MSTKKEIVNQEVEFVVVSENGVVVESGKTFLYHPEIQFAGSGIHWLEEKTKQGGA